MADIYLISLERLLIGETVSMDEHVCTAWNISHVRAQNLLKRTNLRGKAYVHAINYKPCVGHPERRRVVDSIEEVFFTDDQIADIIEEKIAR
jgi:hypothetical protein